MPTNPEIFYLTEAEYRNQTTVPSLVGSSESEVLTDDEVESLLLEAMALIDAYIGDGWTPYDDDQEFIFPRYQDEDASETAFIPRAVSLSTRLIADAILQQRQKGVLPHELESESNLGHSFSKKASGATTPFGFDVIPPTALGLLQKYRLGGGQFAIAQDEPFPVV